MSATMSRDIPITLIDPDPGQPRTHFDEAALAALATSMVANGLAVPILLRPVGDRYVIVHGERRWRAAQSLGWEAIPADVRELTAEEAHWLALVENIQRSDLTPIEEARAYDSRLATGMTQTELAQKIGKSQSYIAQKLRLLKMPSPLIAYVERGALTEGHVRQLLRIEGFYCTGETDQCTTTIEPMPVTTGNERDDAIANTPVWSLFRDIRPEDNPPAWIATHTLGMSQDILGAAQHLEAGRRAFEVWVADAGGIVPSWAVAAFWWASLAVVADLSVAKLAKHLDLWRERLYSAIVAVWQVFRSDIEPPRDPMLAMDYYGYRSDVRHAGLRGFELNSGLIEEAIELVWRRGGGLTAPSHTQPWGFGYERYRQLEEEREARLARYGDRGPMLLESES